MIQSVISETGVPFVSFLPEFSFLSPLSPLPDMGGMLRLPNSPFHVPALEAFSNSEANTNLQHWHNSWVHGFVQKSILGFLHNRCSFFKKKKKKCLPALSENKAHARSSKQAFLVKLSQAFFSGTFELLFILWLQTHHNLSNYTLSNIHAWYIFSHYFKWLSLNTHLCACP